VSFHACDDQMPEVYLLCLGDHLPDPATGSRVTEAQRLQSIVEQAVVAEESGFTGIAVGEHHFCDYICSAPLLALAAAASRTRHLRLSTGVSLLAHRDPVHVAEELSMLDALSGGRAELIVARGVSPITDQAFGIAPDELRPAFERHLRLLLRLLGEHEVTWSRDDGATVPAITTRPRRVGGTRPQVSVGAGSEQSAELAGQLGLPLTLPSWLRDPMMQREVVELYRERMSIQHGRPGRVGLPTHVHVAPKGVDAVAQWRPYLTAYAEFAHPWRGNGRGLDIDGLLDGAAVCGNPDRVAARLNSLARALDVDVHLVLMDAGGLPLAAVLDGIRLFGREVIPRLAPRQPRSKPAAAARLRNPRRSPFHSIEEAIADIGAGKMVVVCDAEDRENEGDLTLAAAHVTPAAINFMATHGRGLICVALAPDRCDELDLAPMVTDNQSPFGTAFTVSVEARRGVTTGISAFDRARTVQVMADPASRPNDLVSPGHIFPLRAAPMGVLQRCGQTEAAVDLARLAGLPPAGVICEVLNDDGTMARVPDLERYCRIHELKMVTIEDLIAHRRSREPVGSLAGPAG
jgi:3,4-dihydroxy-2-butanone 4-phosphate synthase